MVVAIETETIVEKAILQIVQTVIVGMESNFWYVMKNLKMHFLRQ